MIRRRFKIGAERGIGGVGIRARAIGGTAQLTGKRSENGAAVGDRAGETCEEAGGQECNGR